MAQTKKKTETPIEETTPEKVPEKVTPVITITKQYHLYDWSDSLTFQQICETVYSVGEYFENKEAIPQEQHEFFEVWFTKNDLGKFIDAQMLAAEEQDHLNRERAYAKSIMKQKTKKQVWH